MARRRQVFTNRAAYRRALRRYRRQRNRYERQQQRLREARRAARLARKGTKTVEPHKAHLEHALPIQRIFRKAGGQ